MNANQLHFVLMRDGPPPEDISHLEGSTRPAEDVLPELGKLREKAQAIIREAADRFENNKRLAWKYATNARSYDAQRYAYMLQITLDEYREAALVGLYTAAWRFDPRLGWQFSTYAWQWLRNACGEMRRRYEKDAKHQLIGGADLAAAGETADARLEASEQRARDREQLDSLLGFLGDRERQIVEARFYGEQTLQDVGRRFGISKERVLQIEAGALSRMRAKARGETRKVTKAELTAELDGLRAAMKELKGRMTQLRNERNKERLKYRRAAAKLKAFGISNRKKQTA